ncbi:MAG TPA: hypothetical protein VGK59_02595 [Ohtaekwangia sp.]
MNTFSAPLLIILILGAASCRKDFNRDAGPVRDSVPVAHAEDVAGNIITDTLTEDEFKALFTEKERRAYDLSADQDLQKALEKSEGFWKNKGLIISEEIKRPEIEGYPLSLRVLANGIKRMILTRYGEAGATVTLYTLDRNYNVIGTCMLSDQGGDEDEAWRSRGEFVNDSLYNIISYGYSGSDTANQVMKSRQLIHADGTIETIIDSHVVK